MTSFQNEDAFAELYYSAYFSNIFIRLLTRTNSSLSRCECKDHWIPFIPLIWNYRCKLSNLSVVLLPLAGGCVQSLHLPYGLSIPFFGPHSLLSVMLMIVFVPLLTGWDSKPFFGITIQTIGRLVKPLVSLLSQWTPCMRCWLMMLPKDNLITWALFRLCWSQEVKNEMLYRPARWSSHTSSTISRWQRRWSSILVSKQFSRFVYIYFCVWQCKIEKKYPGTKSISFPLPLLWIIPTHIQNPNMLCLRLANVRCRISLFL